MKTSHLYTISLAIIFMIGMGLCDYSLILETQRINLKDQFNNYSKVSKANFSVLHLSGSNGYPIHIRQSDSNAVRVLRSRLQHFDSQLQNDTLYINFRGANIPQYQAFDSKTPAGIVIDHPHLSSIISENTHNKIQGFKHQNISIHLSGTATALLEQCHMRHLGINASNNSQFHLLRSNTIDSLNISMSDHSIGHFEGLNFKHLSPVIQDSAQWILSKKIIEQILKYKY